MTPRPDVDARLRQLRALLPEVPLARVLAWIDAAPPPPPRRWPWPLPNRRN